MHLLGYTGKRLLPLLAAAIAFLPAGTALAGPADATLRSSDASLRSTSWPQLQQNPQRTGFTPHEVAPPYRLAWKHNFQPQRVGRSVQPIIADGRTIVPTEAGKVYAFASQDGQPLWTADVGSPVEHSVACADGKVLVASLDGVLHALDAATGEPKWTFRPAGRRNFSQAPCVADGKVFLAARQGELYAVNLADGSPAWKRDLGVPVYQSAAWNDGTVYIGGEDIRLRAFRSADGEPVWTSEQLYGQSLKEYHPVIAGGHVLVRPMPAHPSREYFNSNWGKDPAVRPDYIFQATWDHFAEWSWNLDAQGNRPKATQDIQAKFTPFYTRELVEAVKAGKMPETLLKAQDAVVEHYRQNPYDQDLFVLNAADGKQAYIAPHFHCLSLPGPACPPAVTADGSVVIPWIFITHTWARLDLKSGRVAEIMLTQRGSNGDETVNVSVGGRFLYILHCNETGPSGAYSGVFNFTDKTWHALPTVPDRHGQLTDNCQSGNAAASIADGRIYHIVAHQIAAYAHDDNPPVPGRRGR